jgi:steroid 5-alpha reductase family enzyme
MTDNSPMIRSSILLALALIGAIAFGAPFDSSQWALLREASLIALVFALVCFVVAEWSGNYAQVDKLWQIMPPIYAWYFAAKTGWDLRQVIIALLVTIWGLRLVYNFSRRGGFGWPIWTGHEDYRWTMVRTSPQFQSKVAWTLFNFFFISIYQHFLLLSITLPALYATRGAGSFNAVDALAALLVLGCIAVEAIADQQQYRFQTEKYRRIKANEPLEGDAAKGFLTTGLFAFSRHPNFAAEQLLWWALYLFSVAATGQLWNVSIIGTILLTLLFQGSANMTEAHSSKKYPAYADYQRRVPRFLPWFKTSAAARPANLESSSD